jgi:hypothetical protein
MKIKKLSMAPTYNPKNEEPDTIDFNLELIFDDGAKALVFYAEIVKLLQEQGS